MYYYKRGWILLRSSKTFFSELLKLMLENCFGNIIRNMFSHNSVIWKNYFKYVRNLPMLNTLKRKKLKLKGKNAFYVFQNEICFLWWKEWRRKIFFYEDKNLIQSNYISLNIKSPPAIFFSLIYFAVGTHTILWIRE